MLYMLALSLPYVARGLFQLAVAYAIGSPPRLEDSRLPILCQLLVYHVLFGVVFFLPPCCMTHPFRTGKLAVKSGDPALNQPRAMRC